MPDATPALVETYRAAVSANPDSAEAQSNLGWGYYGLRQYDQAIEAYRQALSLDANYIDAHYGLGLALKEAGKGQEAIASFETAIKLAPQLSNPARAQMLIRLARGHINQIQTGNWNLAGIVTGTSA